MGSKIFKKALEKVSEKTHIKIKKYLNYLDKMNKIKNKTIDIENASRELLAFDIITPELVGEIANKYDIKPEFLVKLLEIKL